MTRSAAEAGLPVRAMKTVATLLLVSLCILAGAAKAAIWDTFRSPTGVYTWSESTAFKESVEEIDVRSDNTYIWTFRTKFTYPGIPPNQSEYSRRGHWKSFGAAVTLFLGDNTETSFAFNVDDGDLIEKAGQRRRFNKKKP